MCEGVRYFEGEMVFVSDCGGKESVYGFFMRFKGVKCQSSINLLVHKFRLSLPLLAKHFSAIHLRPFLAPIQSNTITTPCSINLSRSPSQIFKQTCENTQTLIIFSDFASQSQTPELPHHAPNSLAHIHRSIRPYFLYTPLPYDGDVRLARQTKVLHDDEDSREVVHRDQRQGFHRVVARVLQLDYFLRSY